ncbi:MAG: hypothetical protein EBX41_01180 [Chitinophagia bacterium]|nr:hypothetical protein [Chitinophagia bacterium]
MKKSFLVVLIAGILCQIVLSSDSRGYRGNVTGSTGAGTGANQGCSCHGSQNGSIDVSVELDSAGTAVNHYTPGGSYTIKISGVNNSSSSLPKFGFQLSAVLANATPAGGNTMAGQPGAMQAGTWGTSLPTGTSSITVGSLFLIGHSTPLAAATGTGGSGTTYVQSIPWTAPAANSGAVVIYGVLNAVNGNSASNGDLFNIAKTLYIPEIGKEATCP